MANKSTAVNETLTNSATSVDDFELGEGGIVRLDIEWLSGTPATKILTKIPGGTAFVDAVDVNSVALSKSVTTSDRHACIELLGQAGQLYRLSNSGTGAVNVAVSRVGTY